MSELGIRSPRFRGNVKSQSKDYAYSEGLSGQGSRHPAHHASPRSAGYSTGKAARAGTPEACRPGAS